MSTHSTATIRSFRALPLLAIFNVLLLSSISHSLLAQFGAPDQGANKVEWLSLEEAMQRMETEPRKIFIDLYTDWCGWCKRMDASTLSNPMIVEYLNEKWYAIKFNAEQKDPITFNGKEYLYVPSGSRGYHQLAYELAGGRLSYPTTVYLDERGAPIQAIPGFKDAPSLDKILKFFGENHYLTQSWVAFQMEYKSPLGQTGSN